VSGVHVGSLPHQVGRPVEETPGHIADDLRTAAGKKPGKMKAGAVGRDAGGVFYSIYITVGGDQTEQPKKTYPVKNEKRGVVKV